MVKFANKAKGRPSKRKTLKVKYKIERRVKQHNKRVKKQAKKLKGKGLKHKGVARSDFLPNMFPFKQQLLQDAKGSLPKTQQIEMNLLDQTQYGLINLENKCAYLPKPKENLIKKYVTNLQFALSNVKVVLEILDVKNPAIYIDNKFRQKCIKQKVKIISIITKIDTVPAPKLEKSIAIAKSLCETVIAFSSDHKQKAKCIEQLQLALKTVEPCQILVAGKALTGKHTFITIMAKANRCYQISPCELQTFKLEDGFSLIDSPYKIPDQTDNPFFYVPNPLIEESLQAQQQKLIRKLFIGQNSEKPVFKRDAVVEHFSIQDYTNMTDFVSKVGKVSKSFGKGGSIDLVRTRTKIISDWLTGRLNCLLEL